MAIRITNLERHLIAAGLVPPDCYNITVEFQAAAAPQLHYTVRLTTERLEQFQRAFAAYLDDGEPPPPQLDCPHCGAVGQLGHNCGPRF